MSTLKKFQNDPNHLLNTAFNLYKSKRIRTAIVEGVCDKRFLMQWTRKDVAIRFDGLEGKSLVEEVFRRAQEEPFSTQDFLYYFADVDYDGIVSRKLHEHPKFIYNAFCDNEQKVIYNDLEIYLVNSSALEKMLSNLDVDPASADSLRTKLEQASRKIGALRASDEILRKRVGLRNSVLNGLEVHPFFDPASLSIDIKRLEESLPNWTNYRHHVDDLIETARNISRDSPAEWSLSRGHDVTEMLSLYMERIGHKGMRRERIELMLRLACEMRDYLESPMGRKLCKCEPAGNSFLKIPLV